MEYFIEDFALIDTNTSSKVTAKNTRVTLDDLHHLDKEMRVAKVKDPDRIISYLTNENNIKADLTGIDSRDKGLFRKDGLL
jgi:NAD+ synthase (glutamine-hydrolysing)